MIVVTIRIIEIANCVTTSTFRKLMLPLPTLNKPFNVFTGWKDDINNAGYIPEINPIRKGDKNKGRRISHFNKISIVRCCPETLFNHGNAKYNKASAIKIADHAVNID